MTISEECIEAEVEVEVRRIAAWNDMADCPNGCPPKPLSIHQVQSLANHLVRNRLQAEIAQVELRRKGHMLGQEALHSQANCKVTGGCYLCLLETWSSTDAGVLYNMHPKKPWR